MRHRDAKATPMPGNEACDAHGETANSPPEFNRAADGYRDGGDSTNRYRYGYGDYRGSDYSNLDDRGSDPRAASANNVDFVGAIRRHPLIVFLPLLAGLGLGWMVFAAQPSVYRSTTELLIENDRPTILDSTTGDPYASVPDGDLLVALLKSDQVLTKAAQDAALRELKPWMSQRAIRSMLSQRLAFRQSVSQRSGRGTSVYLLHVDHSDREVAEMSVRALSSALEKYLADRGESAVKELTDLIATARDKLKPELDRLEQAYQEYCRSTELTWDASGKVINPHRERQKAIQTQLDQLEAERHRLQARLAAIKGELDKTQDPIAVIEVVRQLNGQSSLDNAWIHDAFSSIDRADSELKDLRLERLNIDRMLVPLEVKRERYASQLAPKHPLIEQLDREIVLTRQKLNELTKLENERRGELRTEADRRSAIKAERRKLAVQSLRRIVHVYRNEQSILTHQIADAKLEMKRQGKQAKRLANTISENAMHRRKIKRHQALLDQIEEAMARVHFIVQDKGLVVEALSAPSPAYQIAPKRSQFLIIGALLGAACGLGLAYLRESQARVYHSASEIARGLGIPVLAHIPDDDQKMPEVSEGETYRYAEVDPSLAVIHRPHSTASEAVRRLRTAIFFDTKSYGSTVIQMTSPLPADGKSTVSANLAVSIATTGKRVVLVDADLRRPALSEAFSLGEADGLSEVLDHRCVPTQVIYDTPLENLSIIPSGDIPTNPAEALSMPRFAELIVWLRERYDYVILDAPPLLVVSDPAIICEQADGVVFAFRIRRGCRPQTKEAVAMLHGAGARLIGVVVNRSDEAISASGYHSSEADGYRYGDYSYNDRGGQAGKKGKFMPRRKNFFVSSNAKSDADAADEELNVRS